MEHFNTPASGQYHSISIAEALAMIDTQRLTLPLIQRNFVWDIDRITKLFDSVLQGYPINSMLFWEVPSEATGSVQMYRFIRNYTQFDAFEKGRSATSNGERNHNALMSQPSNSAPDPIYAVLDGQQRLTSFYMGLCGSYATKLHYGRYGYLHNYPPRALYLCVSDLAPEGDTLENYRSNRYQLKWQQVAWRGAQPGQLLAAPYRTNKAKTELWLHLGEVMRGAGTTAEAWAAEQLQALRTYAASIPDASLPESDFEQSRQTLERLHHAVHAERCISFYLDKGESLARAVETFIRINSGGMSLNYSDLLFSIISSEWKTLQAREVVDSLQRELRHYVTGLDLEKGFILKAALVMVAGRNMRFELGQFTSQRVQDMEQAWPRIEKAIVLAAHTIADCQLHFLNSPALATTIAFYCYNFLVRQESTVLSQRDRDRIYQWLIRARLLWSNEKYSTETKLSALLGIIATHFANGHHDFPFQVLVSQSWGVDMRLANQNGRGGILLDELVQQSKHHPTTKFLLGLLQSNMQRQVTYDIDHCFPHSESWKAAEGVWSEEYEGRSDSLPNLQLLPDSINRSKGDLQFHDWYAGLDELLTIEAARHALKVATRDELHQAHLYPTPLPAAYHSADEGITRLAKFDSFYKLRHELIRQRLEVLFADPA